MAQLTAIAIVCALIADFFLLPALLLVVDKDDSPKELETDYEPATA